MDLTYTTSLTSMMARLSAIPVSNRPLKLDMSFSRINATYLPYLLDWLAAHDNVSVSLCCTDIQLPEMCAALLHKMGHLDWVLDGRIFVGCHAKGMERNDRYARAFLAGHALGVSDALFCERDGVAGWTKLRYHLADASPIIKEPAVAQHAMTNNQCMQADRVNVELAASSQEGGEDDADYDKIITDVDLLQN